MDELNDAPFLQIVYNCDVCRCYYIKSVSRFFFYEVNIAEIVPFASVNIVTVRNRIVGMLKGKNNIECQFFYPTTTKKKYKKIIELMHDKYEEKHYDKLIMSSLLLLKSM